MPEVYCVKYQLFASDSRLISVRFRYTSCPLPQSASRRPSRALLLLSLPVVEDRPEQVELKPAVVPVHILPVRVVDIINPRQSDIIPCANPQTDRALITQSRAPRKFRAVREIPDTLILILAAAYIEVYLRPGLQIEAAREPNLRHQRHRDVG